MQISYSFSAKKGRKQTLWVQLCAVLCVGLVMMAASLQVCHFHAPGNQGGPDHCQICIAIHPALPTTAQAVCVITHAAPEYLVPSTLSRYYRIWALHLPSRAPPVEAVLS